MNKKKTLKFVQNIISIVAIIAIIYIINQYDKIADFYIQKTENYADLKKLNEEILNYYQIDLQTNEKLYDLSRKVNYNEHMIAGLEPNTENAKNYWWYLMGVFWLVIISRWIDNINEHTVNETSTK